MALGQVLIREQHGDSDYVHYARRENLRVERIIPKKTISKNILGLIWNFFCEIVLPHGYPDTVSDDYVQYQIWDTLQAFCSTITGAFTTRAILKGVGVGDSEATALSATITWIMKDGTGMIGRIFFAWWKGSGLDCDCKKWRLFADFLNDVAMIIELTLPYFTHISMVLLCITSTMKSIVGIAGGATRASITYHQAVAGNMADISAKDGTQETLVNLIASFTSIYLLTRITDPVLECIFILTLISLHLLTNYNAVKTLVFKNFNNQRITLLLRSYFILNTVLIPQKINQKECVILGCGMKIREICGFNILIGHPLKSISRLYNYEQLKQLSLLYKESTYILISDVEKMNIYVGLEKGFNTQHALEAYFHSVLLACATCLYNDIPLDIVSNRQRNYSTPIARLTTLINAMERDFVNARNLPIDQLVQFNKFVETEINMFFTSLDVNGWGTNSHSLEIGPWRADWKTHFDKKIN